MNRGHPSSSSSSGTDAGEQQVLPANLGAFIPSIPDDTARHELAEYQERVATELPAVRIHTDMDASIIEEQELGSSAPLPATTSATTVPDIDIITTTRSPDTSIRSDSPFDTKMWMRQLEKRQQAKLDAAMQQLRQKRTQDNCQLLEAIHQLLQPAAQPSITVGAARTQLSAEAVPTSSESDVDVEVVEEEGVEVDVEEEASTPETHPVAEVLSRTAQRRQPGSPPVPATHPSPAAPRVAATDSKETQARDV
jgi:hypothetical protein